MLYGRSLRNAGDITANGFAGDTVGNVTSDTSDIGQGCLLAAGICQPMTESSLGILMSVMETWVPGTIVYHFQLHLSDLSVDFGQSEWHH